MTSFLLSLAVLVTTLVTMTLGLSPSGTAGTASLPLTAVDPPTTPATGVKTEPLNITPPVSSEHQGPTAMYAPDGSMYQSVLGPDWKTITTSTLISEVIAGQSVWSTFEISKTMPIDARVTFFEKEGCSGGHVTQPITLLSGSTTGKQATTCPSKEVNTIPSPTGADWQYRAVFMGKGLMECYWNPTKNNPNKKGCGTLKSKLDGCVKLTDLKGFEKDGTYACFAVPNPQGY